MNRVRYQRGCVLYKVPIPTHTRLACSAHAWWARAASRCRGEGGNQPTPRRNLVEARAEGRPRDWVAELGVCGTSIACQSHRKAILVVLSGEGNIPRHDCHLAAHVASWAPRGTLCTATHKALSHTAHVFLYQFNRVNALKGS